MGSAVVGPSSGRHVTEEEEEEVIRRSCSELMAGPEEPAGVRGLALLSAADLQGNTEPRFVGGQVPTGRCCVWGQPAALGLFMSQGYESPMRSGCSCVHGAGDLL